VIVEETTKTLETIAIHESGHAVSMLELGFRFKSVSVIPDAKSLGRAGGYLYFTPSLSRRDLFDWVVCKMAGGAAEWIFKNGIHRRWNTRTNVLAGGGDYNTAWDAFRPVYGILEVERHLKRAQNRAVRLLKQPETWRKVNLIAKALLNSKTLSEDEVMDIIHCEALECEPGDIMTRETEPRKGKKASKK
jgi:ATP-dependent Zn protease